jgi:hypothetical protein
MLKRYSDQALVESAARLMNSRPMKTRLRSAASHNLFIPCPQPGSLEWFDAQKKKG